MNEKATKRKRGGIDEIEVIDEIDGIEKIDEIEVIEEIEVMGYVRLKYAERKRGGRLRPPPSEKR